MPSRIDKPKSAAIGSEKETNSTSNSFGHFRHSSILEISTASTVPSFRAAWMLNNTRVPIVRWPAAFENSAADVNVIAVRLSMSRPARFWVSTKKRRRRVEFLGFMDKVVAAFPDRELHVVLDNLNTHKKNERWLKKHPRVHFHFTPTRASWLNQIETWFSILQGQSLSGASFTAVSQLQEHIDAFISAANEKAEPFFWTKKKVRQRRFKGRRITQL